MSSVIVNKVAESALQTIDLEAWIPTEEPVVFDLKDFLFMGLIVKEKEFRASLQQTDTSVFNGKVVLVTCSADAIIPMWAYMLVAALLQPVAVMWLRLQIHLQRVPTILYLLDKMPITNYI